MKYVGIDIGSTASKIVIMDEDKENILYKKVVPSGWNSKETANMLNEWIDEHINNEDRRVVATGYGRISVPYANKAVTEITCHAKGATYLSKGRDLVVIDIGGQDTKVIHVENNMVEDFIMNDKCSAGTGKFLEIMANRLGLSLEEMFVNAAKGKDLKISSTCTVFAESEVISLMGLGTPREDIAKGVVSQIVSKVMILLNRKKYEGDLYLTGGFSKSEFVRSELEKAAGRKVFTDDLGRFAGAIGACLVK